ncbi:MAG: hypothetical protein GY716_00300 [bacterium]|nr:hypothetical protein [bacterium]
MKWTVCGAVGILILSMAAIRSAPTETLTVEFYDAQGNLLTGLDVAAFTDAASRKVAADDHPGGRYELDLPPGKITFYTSGQLGSYNPHTVLLPEDFDSVLQLTLYQQGGQNLCANAAELELGSVTAGNTTGAGTDPGVAQTACGTSITEGGDMLFYDLTLLDDTLIAVSTCNDGNPATGSAEFDSKISVFCQNCDTADFTCVGGNDDGPGCADFSSAFTFCGRGFGTTYHIMVHGFLGATGSFELAVIDAGPCTSDEQCAQILGPPPLGACCFDNCDELTAVGINTSEALEVCAELSCSQDEFESERCEAAGGTYLGDDVPCVVLSDTSVSYSSTPALPIPDNDPGGVRDEIVVADNGGFVGDVDVDLVLTHTWIGDLRAAVTNKDTGTEVVLWNRNCGSSSTLDILSNDEGTQTFCGPAGGPTTGSIPPALTNGFESFLADFDGQAIDGAWSLHVDDNFTGDTGELTFWSLIFREGTSSCPTACEPVTPPDPGGPGNDEDSDSGDSADAGPEAFLATGRDNGAEGLIELDASTSEDEDNRQHDGRPGRRSGKPQR